jgi:hypothetical protein
VGESSTEPPLWLDVVAGGAPARGLFSLQRPPQARESDGGGNECEARVSSLTGMGHFDPVTMVLDRRI